MRIAVIGQRDNPYQYRKVYGGVDTVERNQLELFQLMNNEVHFITSSNSEDFRLVVTHKLSQPSKFNPPADVYAKARNSEIRSLLVSIKPDLIVVHDSITKGLADAFEGIAPTICYMHDVAGIFGLSSINYVKTYIELLDTVVVAGVSENSNIEWNKFVNQTKQVEIKRYFEDFHLTPILWDLPASVMFLPDSVDSRMVGIGRLVEQKNFPRSVYVTKDTKKEFHLFYPGIRDDSEKELFYSLSKENIFMHQGKEHWEIMKFLAGSSGLLVTGKESFGLTAFEANCRGVPVFLYATGPHAVQEATCREGLYKFSDKKEMREAIRDFQPLSLQQRISIQEEMSKKFCKEESYRRFLPLVKKATEMFNSRNTLESFV